MAAGPSIPAVTILVDEDVPEAVASFLTARGYPVLLVRDYFGRATADAVIAAAASQENRLVYTLNRRHFVALARKQRKTGALSYPGMSVVSFNLRAPFALARLQVLISDIEAVYRSRVLERGARMIAVISETVLRFEDPESRRPPRPRA